MHLVTSWLTNLLSTLVLLTLLCCVQSVDRSTFKTCDQSSFCKRHRNLPVGASPYFLQMSSVKKVSAGCVEGHLVHSGTGIVLKLQLFALADGILRLRVDEITPLRERFEPKESFVKDPVEDKFKIANQDGQGMTLTFGNGHKAVVTSSPFRLDVYSNDQLVISSNPRGLLRFEHYRLKNQKAPETEGENPPEGQAPVVEENQEGMWEESFKAHSDTKPHGPSSIGMDLSFVGFEHVYGIPEHADTFALKQTKGVSDPYRLYNLDVFEYELSNPMALYGSVPYMIAHSETRTVGVVWLNAAETWVDIEATNNQGVVSSIVDYVKGNQQTPQRDTHWISEGGVMNVFFLLGPGPKDLMRQYSGLFGQTPLPPMFSVGYHQCRWNYNDQDDVRNVDAGFDHHDIPYDVIWLDVDHTDDRKYFTWEPHKFPTPEVMLNNITAKGRKMVTLIDPHIKRDNSYFIHSEAANKGYYIKNRNGEDYDGWCWPGSSSYMDFLNPEVRDWWSTRFQLDVYKGSTLSLFTWNDMNEPSVFNGPEITMHKDAKHFGNWEHRDVHNYYGMLLPMSTYKGHLLRSNGEHRPFILSRAFFVGSQRFGAVWTGDNTADWGHLKISVPMLLTLSVTGLPFCGADVGGFFKNPDAELNLRWYQAGAFQPFFRAHAHLDSKRREPWLFDEATKLRIRDVIRKRYSYLPLWYTLFHEHERNGMPIMRPIWMEFPTEVDTFTTEDQYMLGSVLLVHPVLDQGVTSVDVYLPGKQDVWYDIDTYQRYVGHQKMSVPVNLDKIPVYQRGGTIIPKKERIRRSSSLGQDDPYTLIVALSKQGQKANGSLYMDDGYSTFYKNGDYLSMEFSFQDNVLNSKIISGPGNFQTKAWLERVVILGYASTPKAVFVTSHALGNQEIRFSYNKQQQILIIRRPGPSMSEDWSIQVK